jgi:hypothetical protein
LDPSPARHGMTRQRFSAFRRLYRPGRVSRSTGIAFRCRGNRKFRCFFNLALIWNRQMSIGYKKPAHDRHTPVKTGTGS